MRKLGLLCVLWGIGCLLLSVSTEKARYDGYTLSRVHIASEEQRQAVASLGLDAWTFESDIVIGENHILLPPNLNHSLAVDFHISVLDNIIDDLQELLDQQEAARMKRKAKLDSFFEDYHDYGEIVYEAKRLADAHPSIVTFLPSIGTSVQGRVCISPTTRLPRPFNQLTEHRCGDHPRWTLGNCNKKRCSRPHSQNRIFRVTSFFATSSALFPILMSTLKRSARQRVDRPCHRDVYLQRTRQQVKDFFPLSRLMILPKIRDGSSGN